MASRCTPWLPTLLCSLHVEHTLADQQAAAASHWPLTISWRWFVGWFDCVMMGCAHPPQEVLCCAMATPRSTDLAVTQRNHLGTVLAAASMRAPTGPRSVAAAAVTIYVLPLMFPAARFPLCAAGPMGDAEGE